MGSDPAIARTATNRVVCLTSATAAELADIQVPAQPSSFRGNWIHFMSIGRSGFEWLGEGEASSKVGSTSPETTVDEHGWVKIAVTRMNRLFALFAIFVNYLQFICRLFVDYL